jgi:hypothetical protein
MVCSGRRKHAGGGLQEFQTNFFQRDSKTVYRASAPCLFAVSGLYFIYLILIEEKNVREKYDYD